MAEKGGREEKKRKLLVGFLLLASLVLIIGGISTIFFSILNSKILFTIIFMVSIGIFMLIEIFTLSIENKKPILAEKLHKFIGISVILIGITMLIYYSL